MKPKCYNKRGKRSKEKPIFNLREATSQWRANWRAAGEPQSQLASQRHVVSGISPVARQLASNWREHVTAARFSQKFSAYKRENLGHYEGIWKTRFGTPLGHFWEAWRAWRTLGSLGNQVGKLGEIWVFLICGCIFLPILHHSSMHSFIVLGFVLFAFMCN